MDSRLDMLEKTLQGQNENIKRMVTSKNRRFGRELYERYRDRQGWDTPANKPKVEWKKMDEYQHSGKSDDGLEIPKKTGIDFRRTVQPLEIYIHNIFDTLSKIEENHVVEDHMDQETPILTEKDVRPPPVVIIEKVKWSAVCEILENHNIKSEKNTKNGIQMFVSSCEMYHESRNHQMEPEDPNKCINCGGDHESNYYGCPMLPKRKNEEKAIPKRPRKPYRTPEKSKENNNPHNNEDSPLNNMLSALEELKELLRRRPILAEMISLKNFPGLPGNRD
ncbi:hypothetical protein JTB14_021411 [Gonioctena quinquepunctata]|nr:hypothetical protein JTB14_021411 [Gonioctena quinquepunctata]